MAIDPLGLLLLAGGTILDVFGQYEQAKSQQASLLYQAEQLRQDAMLIEVRGRIDTRRHRKQTEKMIGSIARDFSKGGVDVSTGSPLLALQETARESALDLYWMQQATQISAARARAGVKQLRGQAQDVSMAASINVVTNILGTVAQAAQTMKIPEPRVPTQPILRVRGMDPPGNNPWFHFSDPAGPLGPRTRRRSWYGFASPYGPVGR